MTRSIVGGCEAIDIYDISVEKELFRSGILSRISENFPSSTAFRSFSYRRNLIFEKFDPRVVRRWSSSLTDDIHFLSRGFYLLLYLSKVLGQLPRLLQHCRNFSLSTTTVPCSTPTHSSTLVASNTENRCISKYLPLLGSTYILRNQKKKNAINHREFRQLALFHRQPLINYYATVLS